MVAALSADSCSTGTPAPAPEPEDLLRLDIPRFIVPGGGKSHAISAARYLEECLPRAEYWDVAVDDQTEQSVGPRLLRFLDSIKP